MWGMKRYKYGLFTRTPAPNFAANEHPMEDAAWKTRPMTFIQKLEGGLLPADTISSSWIESQVFFQPGTHVPEGIHLG